MNSCTEGRNGKYIMGDEFLVCHSRVKVLNDLQYSFYTFQMTATMNMYIIYYIEMYLFAEFNCGIQWTNKILNVQHKALNQNACPLNPANK